jgi:hypothetical protein
LPPFSLLGTTHWIGKVLIFLLFFNDRTMFFFADFPFTQFMIHPKQQTKHDHLIVKPRLSEPSGTPFGRESQTRKIQSAFFGGYI